MTEPIPKPEPKRAAVRWIALSAALVALFAAVVLAMLLVLPRPHTQADYMIAGALATMITMLALFGALLTTKLRMPDPFYKRRPKG